MERIDEETIPKRVMLARIKGTRKKECPRSIWMDEVKKDLQQMSVWNWRNVAKNRVGWKRMVLEAKGHLARRVYE